MPRALKARSAAKFVIGTAVHVMRMPRVSSLQSPAPCLRSVSRFGGLTGIVRFCEVTPSLETFFHQPTETYPEPVPATTKCGRHIRIGKREKAVHSRAIFAMPHVVIDAS